MSFQDVKEEDEDKLEIIFVSSDKSEEEQVGFKIFAAVFLHTAHCDRLSTTSRITASG